MADSPRPWYRLVVAATPAELETEVNALLLADYELAGDAFRAGSAFVQPLLLRSEVRWRQTVEKSYR